MVPGLNGWGSIICNAFLCFLEAFLLWRDFRPLYFRFVKIVALVIVVFIVLIFLPAYLPFTADTVLLIKGCENGQISIPLTVP